MFGLGTGGTPVPSRSRRLTGAALPAASCPVVEALTRKGARVAAARVWWMAPGPEGRPPGGPGVPLGRVAVPRRDGLVASASDGLLAPDAVQRLSDASGDQTDARKPVRNPDKLSRASGGLMKPPQLPELCPGS